MEETSELPTEAYAGQRPQTVKSCSSKLLQQISYLNASTLVARDRSSIQFPRRCYSTFRALLLKKEQSLWGEKASRSGVIGFRTSVDYRKLKKTWVKENSNSAPPQGWADWWPLMRKFPDLYFSSRYAGAWRRSRLLEEAYHCPLKQASFLQRPNLQFCSRLLVLGELGAETDVFAVFP